MPDSAISGLPDIGVPVGDEYVEVVGTPDAAPVSRKMRGYRGVGVGRLRFIFYAADEMIVGSQDERHFEPALNGTGDALTGVSPPNNEAGVGFLRFDLGTVATNSVALIAPKRKCLRLYNGAARFLAKLGTTQLSNVTDDYTQRVGFIDDELAEPNDGVYFRQNYNVNAGKWQAVCRKDGTETTADTGVTPTAGEVLKRLEGRTNAAASSAEFYIDGLLKATIVANIPNTNTAAHDTGFGIAVLRTAGTAALPSITADYLEVEQIFNTAR